MAGQVAGPSRRLFEVSRRLSAPLVRSASLYNFYNLELRVSCFSSSVCRNVSSTMEHIRAAPEVAATALRAVTNQPLIRVLSIDINTMVMGNAAPGLPAAPISPAPAVKLYHDVGADPHQQHVSRAHLASLQTMCVAGLGCLAVAAMVGCGGLPGWRVRWARHRREIGGPVDNAGSALMQAVQNGPFSDSE